jgi:hypothetical protein
MHSKSTLAGALARRSVASHRRKCLRIFRLEKHAAYADDMSSGGLGSRDFIRISHQENS